MKIKIFLLSVLFTGCLTSCQRLMLNVTGALDDKATFKKIKNTNREILFIPMHHVGKQEFYDDVKRKIDSLRNEGFAFLYEGVKHFRDTDSLKNDTIRRKVRKILWVDVLSKKMKAGYIDSSGNTSVGISQKSIKKYELVNQPRRSASGIDSVRDIWADVYLTDLVEGFEKKYGRITLSQCELEWKFDEKYTCERYRNDDERKFMLEGFRNEVLMNKILDDKHAKVAIIYGSRHFNGLVKLLQQKDSTWKVY
jgi:hypothetical protein